MLFPLFIGLLCLADVIFLIVLTIHERTLASIGLLVGTAVAAHFLGAPLLPFLAAHKLYIPIIVLAYLAAGLGWSLFKWTRNAVRARADFQKFVNRYRRPIRGEPTANWDRTYAEKFFVPFAEEERKKLRQADIHAIIPLYTMPETFDETDEQFKARFDKWVISLFGTMNSLGDGEYILALDKNHLNIKVDGLTFKPSMQPGKHKERIINWMALWPFSMVGFVIEDLIIKLWQNLYEMFSGFYQKASDWAFRDFTI